MLIIVIFSDADIGTFGQSHIAVSPFTVFVLS